MLSLCVNKTRPSATKCCCSKRIWLAMRHVSSLFNDLKLYKPEIIYAFIFLLRRTCWTPLDYPIMIILPPSLQWLWWIKILGLFCGEFNSYPIVTPESLVFAPSPSPFTNFYPKMDLYPRMLLGPMVYFFRYVGGLVGYHLESNGGM